MTSFWSPLREAHLRNQWEAGVSCSAIARGLGTTKNAVIGKARRLGLPMRVSPITRRWDFSDA